MEYDNVGLSDNDMSPGEYEKRQQKEFQSFVAKISKKKEPLVAKLTSIDTGHQKQLPLWLSTGLPIIVALCILVNMNASGRPQEMLTAALCSLSVPAIYWLFHFGIRQSRKYKSIEINAQIKAYDKQVADERQLMLNRIQEQKRVYKEAIESIQKSMDDLKCYQLNIVPFITLLSNSKVNPTDSSLILSSIEFNTKRISKVCDSLNSRARQLGYDGFISFHNV